MDRVVVRRGAPAVIGRENRFGMRRRRVGRRRCLYRGRQQPERVDIAVLVVCMAHAQVDKCIGLLAERGDRISLGDLGVPRDCVRAEVLECHGVTVGGADGDRLPARWNGADEADRAGRGRAHGGSRGSTDVDAAVLAAGVGIVSQDEGSKYRPVDGPGPGERGLHADLERDEDRKQPGEAFHGAPPRCQCCEHDQLNKPVDPLSSPTTVTLCKESCAKYP
jgi:hypothetical protein